MPNSSEPAAPPDAAQLCLDCGLCCNGVLFDQVRLQPGDQTKALAARGLKIKKGQLFNQPCTALQGTLCELYEHRPSRCRFFECRQYRGVAAGEIRYESAAARIADVKAQVARIESLLSVTGGGNLRKPLSQRYATAREVSPELVATSGLADWMTRLQTVLDQDFRIGSQVPDGASGERHPGPYPQ